MNTPTFDPLPSVTSLRPDEQLNALIKAQANTPLDEDDFPPFKAFDPRPSGKLLPIKRRKKFIFS